MRQEDYELILDFLRDELTSQQEAIVLERLKTDMAFSNAFYQEQQQFNTFNESSWSYLNDDDSVNINSYEALFKSEKTQQLRASINEASQKYQEKNNGGFYKKWIFYSIAAMLAICFTLYAVFSSTPTPQKLFATNFDATELPGLTVRSTNEDSLLAQAEALYNNEKYAEALPLFDNAIAQNPQNLSTLYLYKGVSHMQVGASNEAETTFNLLIEGDFLDAPKGYWYKALLYLKTNRPEDAKVILQEIVSKNYYQSEKAENVLDDLE